MAAKKTTNKSTSSSSPTGGMSSVSGKSYLVTPSGTVVGSAATPPKSSLSSSSKSSSGGGGRSPGGQPEPTGGITLTTGQSAIVTPSGTVVGSAEPTRNMSYAPSVGRTVSSQLTQSTGTLTQANINPRTGKPYQELKVVETDKSAKNIFGAGESLQRRESFLLTRESRGKRNALISAELFGLGVAGSAVGFGKAVASPIKTGRALFSSALTPIQTAKKARESFSTGVLTNPFGTAGSITGDILIGKGVSKVISKGVTTGTDLYRTRGLKEVSAKDVVAPEYFTGQTYPQIKKGQTAGELLTEFKQPNSGFTASPNPIKGKSLGRGTSELPGLYQAPKLSPTFLKLTPGKSPKLLSLKLSETLRPTILKVQPTSYELAPGVKPGQKTLASVSTTKAFFEQRATKGKAYVPFIKSEKEAVIPFDTGVTFVERKSFIKFEGRRIPIDEYKTSPGEVSLTKATKGGSSKTARGLSDISYSSRVGRASRYDIADVSRVFTLSSSSPKYSDTNFYPQDYSRSSVRGSSRKSFFTSSSRIYSSSKSSGRGGGSSSFTPRRISYYPSFYSGGSSYSSPSFTSSSYFPSSFPGGFGLKSGGKSTSSLKGIQSRYQPSLTAISFNIFGKAPKLSSKGFVGVGQERVIPIFSTRRKTKSRRRR